MELVAALPSELLTSVAPPAGGAAPALRSTDQDAAAASAMLPFELLIGLLKAAAPGGESLPAAGNPLPAATLPVAGTTPANPRAAPAAVPPSPTATTGNDVLARLRLAAAAAPAAANATATATAQTGDAAGTGGALPPFAAGDAKPLEAPAAPAAAPAPAATAAPPPQASAAAEVAAALALPRAANGDRPAPRPSPPFADSGGAVEGSAPLAAGIEPQGNAVANAVKGTEPVASTNATTVPAHRDPALEVLPPLPAAGSDAATTSATGGAVPPPPAHAASAAAPAASDPASAAQGPPIDTRAEHWHDALASRVHWLVDQQVGEARIKLNPPELGAVDVKISVVEDKTFVHLTTATTAARDELAQSLPRLRDLLASSGLSLGGATVQGGQGGHGGGDAAPRSSAAAFSPFLPADDEIAPVRLRPTARGRIDLFA